MQHEKPVIGITMGDYNGIGPEIILKLLSDPRIAQHCTPVVYASNKVLSKYRKLLNIEQISFFQTQDVKHISHKKNNLINCCEPQQQEIEPGTVQEAAGRCAFACLQQAVADIKSGSLDAIVTAPINKLSTQQEGFNYPGHTEYFGEQFGGKDPLMLMVHEQIKVAVVTGHIPLMQVANHITRERVFIKLKTLLGTLKHDFGIVKPRVAVLGLNPHAGENGMLGNEEQLILMPLIEEARQKGHLVYGPYPADGFFGQHDYRRFDGVLAMYHDQGLIPFKAIAGEEGVNYTAGQPYIRTSPAHGTAYKIAGKGIANENSMRAALFMACDIVKRRQEEKLASVKTA